MTYSSSEHPPGATPRGIDRMLFHEYEAPATGLPLFRIVLALLLLVLWAYNAEWVTRLPDSFLDPRPGPFLLMQSVPPVQVIHAIEVARVLALGALLVGWRTPTASVLVSLLTMTVYGITYSFGKIDHTILLAVTPMVLAPSGWGGRWSIDAWRGRRPPARGWPLALLAVTFGAAYANAGLAKAMGGWWHWDTQAAQGYVLRLVRMKGDVPLGALMESLDAPVLWELVDVATLAMEIGVLVCALRLRWFRSGLLGLVGAARGDLPDDGDRLREDGLRLRRLPALGPSHGPGRRAGAAPHTRRADDPGACGPRARLRPGRGGAVVDVDEPSAARGRRPRHRPCRRAMGDEVAADGGRGRRGRRHLEERRRPPPGGGGAPVVAIRRPPSVLRPMPAPRAGVPH